MAYNDGMSESRRRKSANWRRRWQSDAYVVAAQKRNYRARSAFKLLQMAADAIAPGSVVVDLGAAPGGWSQVLRERVGAGGQVVAVDILPMQPIDGVDFIRGDFCAAELRQQIAGKLKAAPDAVVSDIAPNLSGARVTDQENSAHLNESVIAFAAERLKPGGLLLFKAFAGESLHRSQDALQQCFGEVKIIKPDSSRRRSREMYFLARRR